MAVKKLPETHMVKRRGKTEKYSERKVYASVYSACMAAHMGETKSENAASKVCAKINFWIIPKKTVTSKQIGNETHKWITKVSKDAASMYKSQRDAK